MALQVAEVALCGGCEEPAVMATAFLAAPMAVQVEYRCVGHYAQFVALAHRTFCKKQDVRDGA
jgi:hypothetical protein